MTATPNANQAIGMESSPARGHDDQAFRWLLPQKAQSTYLRAGIPAQIDRWLLPQLIQAGLPFTER